MSHLLTMPGSGAQQASASNLSSLAQGNSNIWNTYMPQLASSLSKMTTSGDPGLTLQESTDLGNNAAKNQLAYKQAGAALNSRNLFGSNVPASMMTNLANENIAQTGAIQTGYAQAQSQARMKALMELLGLTQNAGSAAANEWGQVGNIGANEAQASGNLFSGVGSLIGLSGLPGATGNLLSSLFKGYAGTPGVGTWPGAGGVGASDPNLTALNAFAE